MRRGGGEADLNLTLSSSDELLVFRRTLKDLVFDSMECQTILYLVNFWANIGLKTKQKAVKGCFLCDNLGGKSMCSN